PRDGSVGAMKTGRLLWFALAGVLIVAGLYLADRYGGFGLFGARDAGARDVIASGPGNGAHGDPRGAEIAALLRTQGPEAAAARLTADLPTLGRDPTYVASVASALVEALERSARDPVFVSAVLPLVERLLEDVAANPERASAGELECLALLRVGQARYVEAVKLAELAIRKEPASARPNVVL